MKLHRIGILAAVTLLFGACSGGDSTGDDVAPDAAPLEPDATPSNAALSGLTVTAGVLDPPFEPEIDEYHLDLVLAEEETAFVPTAAGAASTTITIDGTAVASGETSSALSIEPGSRDVDVVVTAADGTALTYRVHVHRGVDVLSNLETSAGALAPAFETTTTDYGLAVVLATADTTVTPTALIPARAVVTVEGLAVVSGTASAAIPLAPGDNALDVVVAPLTRPGQGYVIGLARGTDALGSVSLLYGGVPIPYPILPAFDPTTSSYSVGVGVWIYTVQVVVTPLLPGATLQVGGADVAAGVPSPPRTLSSNATTLIPIRVTAPDGTQRTYAMNVSEPGATLQVATTASNSESDDQFGSAVAVWGDTMVVGAAGESSAGIGVDANQLDNSAPYAGAVYVFVRTGDVWSQQAYIKASNATSFDGFGAAVALWDDTLVVGAPGAPAAYVFTRSGTTWTERAILAPTPAPASFGSSLALWGDTLAVGAPDESSDAVGIGGDPNNTSAPSSGAVYVYAGAGATWPQQAYIKASNPDLYDDFGRAVSLWGETLAVGAPYEDSATITDPASNTEEDSGAVYVFTRAATTWTQQAYLKAISGDPLDEFGSSIALWRDDLAIGAPNEDSIHPYLAGFPSDISEYNNSCSNCGVVYVYHRNGTSWSRSGFLKSDNPDPGDKIGTSVAIGPERIFAGAPGDDLTATDSGVVLMFWNRNLSTDQLPMLLKAANAGANDHVASSLSLWFDTLVAGTPDEDGTGGGLTGDSGTVYVFR